jgi:hypothetical protein
VLGLNTRGYNILMLIMWIMNIRLKGHGLYGLGVLGAKNYKV